MSEGNLKIWTQMLQNLQEAGDTVWIAEHDSNRESDSEEDIPYLQCHLLAANPDGSIVIQPKNDNGRLFPRLRMILDILAFDSHQRWQGLCGAMKACNVKLTANTEVQGIQLTPPKNLQSAQRRDRFRVEAFGSPVSFLPGDRRTPVEATLMDLSTSGMRIQLKNNKFPNVESLSDVPLMCTIDLPDSKETIEIRGSVERISETRRGQIHLGISFKYDNSPEATRTEQALSRFVVALQREELSRRKSA